jgi:hypothetical protein
MNVPFGYEGLGIHPSFYTTSMLLADNQCTLYRPKFTLKFIIDVYVCKIIFHAFLGLCNYYIMYYNGPPASGLGEGLTTPQRNKPVCHEMLQWASELVGSCELGNEI